MSGFFHPSGSARAVSSNTLEKISKGVMGKSLTYFKEKSIKDPFMNLSS